MSLEIVPFDDQSDSSRAFFRGDECIGAQIIRKPDFSFHVFPVSLEKLKGEIQSVKIT